MGFREWRAMINLSGPLEFVSFSTGREIAPTDD